MGEADTSATDGPRTQIVWAPVRNGRHTVTIRRSADGYPPDWNRVYEDGALVRVFPPGALMTGACFFNCSFHGVRSAPGTGIVMAANPRRLEGDE